jgi:hypothetical protein
VAIIEPNLGGRYGAALAATAAAVLLWVPSESGDGALRGAITVVLVAVAVRSLRVGVEVTEELVTYRGYFLTRRVPRRQVRRVTDFPCLVWESRPGRNRWSPMPCFMHSSRVPDRVNRLNRDRVQSLRKALNLRRDGNR